MGAHALSANRICACADDAVAAVNACWDAADTGAAVVVACAFGEAVYGGVLGGGEDV